MHKISDLAEIVKPQQSGIALSILKPSGYHFIVWRHYPKERTSGICCVSGRKSGGAIYSNKDGRSKRTTIPNPFTGGNDVIPKSFPVSGRRRNSGNYCISLTFEVCCTSKLNSPAEGLIKREGPDKGGSWTVL